MFMLTAFFIPVWYDPPPHLMKQQVTTGQEYSQSKLYGVKEQNPPTCKEHMIAMGQSPVFGLLGTETVGLVTNRQYVFMAYRHDLAGSELNSAHREMH